MVLAELYPDLVCPDLPLRSRVLQASGGHRLHVEEHGSPQGIPALVLHGGPGSGASPLLRRFFDPARYRVIVPDQRGAGRSEPRGGTAQNTTADLLDDLRVLRAALDVDRWLVVGGSWGATLALLHAHDAPEAIAGLLLRSTFLARASDIDAFFRDAPAALRDGWRSIATLDPLARRDLARTWSHWEHTCSGKSGDPAEPDAGALDALVARYTVQSHYLAHGCFLPASLPDMAATLPPVPTLLLHGSADRICPGDGALALRERMPYARLRWVDGVGHDPAHPAMVDAMVRALDAFAAQGSFDGAQRAERRAAPKPARIPSGDRPTYPSDEGPT